MKQADPARDYRLLVARGYDSVAPRFNEARAESDDDLVRPLQARLTSGARILDLGCGGLPVSRSLAQQHEVVGVDISRGQIALARVAVPAGRFLVGDMTTAAFRPQSFDAVVSLYAIFHTPRATHEGLFQRIRDWLRPGGLLLASLATHEDAGYTEDFFGVEMYWSNFAMPRYRDMLTSCGFRMIDDRVISHGYGSDAPAESHPMVLAERA
ncbi:MAG: methyltransferase domain-containing protein [Dehalococcoidia bacterium]